MRAEVDDSMWKTANNEELDENKLIEVLEDWGLNGGVDAFDAWLIWKQSDYKAWPFEGGGFQQPEWVKADFITLNLVRAYHEIQAKKPDSGNAINPFEEYEA